MLPAGSDFIRTAHRGSRARRGRRRGRARRTARTGPARPSVSRRADRRDRDRGRLVDGVAVDAGRDRRERDRAGAELVGHAQDRAVTAREQLGVARRRPSRPGPTVWMIHRAARSPAIVATASPVGSGRRPALADHALAVGERLGPGRSRDRAVDAAARPQRRVRGVHDRVDRLRGDVALHELDARPPRRPSYGGATFGHRPTRGPGAVGRLTSWTSTCWCSATRTPTSCCGAAT